MRADFEASPIAPPQRTANTKVTKDIKEPIRIKRRSGSRDLACTSQDLAGLAPDGLVAYLVDADAEIDCLLYLFSYDANVGAALSDAHAIAVAQAIASLSPSYDGSATNGLHGLLRYLHAAYYHAGSQAPTFAASTTSEVAMSYQAFAQSPGFNLFDDEVGSVMGSFIRGVSNAQLAAELLPSLRSILNDYIVENRHTSWWQNSNAFDVMYAFVRSAPLAPMQTAATVELVQQLFDVAADPDLLPNATYVVSEAIWTIGQFLGYGILPSAAVTSLSNLLFVHDELSVPGLWVVKMLTMYNDCHTADSRVSICLGDLVPIVVAQRMPNQFVFDDGAFIVRTAEDEATARALYHATRQTLSQMTRLSHRIAPVPGDSNGTLRAVIFGSRDDYATYQPLLFNIDANNGGIYIEPEGTFYSYQRTPNESIYTLEELFRHEFTHYLVGRYVVPGMWGSTSIYSDGRMTWIDEGFAEFIAGSNATHVDVRRTLVEQVAADAESTMTIAEIVHSNYNQGFRFYRYAGLFFSFLYAYDRSIITAVLDAAFASDPAALDALTESLATDNTLEVAYQQFLVEQIGVLASLTNPSTVPPSLDQLATADHDVVRAEVQQLLGGDPVCTESVRAGERRFVCRHALQSENFEQETSDVVSTLSSSSMSNLAHATCRYGLGQFVYCDGPLASATSPASSALATMQSDFAVIAAASDVQCHPASGGGTFCEFHMESTVDAVSEQLHGLRPAFYRALACTLLDGNQIGWASCAIPN